MHIIEHACDLMPSGAYERDLSNGSIYLASINIGRNKKKQLVATLATAGLATRRAKARRRRSDRKRRKRKQAVARSDRYGRKTSGT